VLGDTWRDAGTYGRFRLQLTTRATSAFSLCGDGSQGIARIRCPSCGFESHPLWPSCAQKRTLLVGEYLSEDLLLTLPHRQFAWTFPQGGSDAERCGSPKVLRVCRRYDRELFAEFGRLLFGTLRRFLCQAAGRSLRCAMVCSHQTFGEFGVWRRRAVRWPA
jgi:hypothetical protein